MGGGISVIEEEAKKPVDVSDMNEADLETVKGEIARLRGLIKSNMEKEEQMRKEAPPSLASMEGPASESMVAMAKSASSTSVNGVRGSFVAMFKTEATVVEHVDKIVEAERRFDLLDTSSEVIARDVKCLFFKNKYLIEIFSMIIIHFYYLLFLVFSSK